MRFVREAFLAPTLVGAWQQVHGYIPCRGFKNVSYGALLATNSFEMYDVLDGLGVYAADIATLWERASEQRNNYQMIESAMRLVKEKHTYQNRISSILEQFA